MEYVMNHLNEILDVDEIMQARLLELENSITAFGKISGVPISFYSSGGELLWECNSEDKMCNCNSAYCNPESHCRRTLRSAMKISLQLGEVYIFLCDSGLANMSFAFTDSNSVIGYFIAGPTIMGTDAEKSLRHIYEKAVTDNVDIPRLMRLSRELRLFSPQETTSLMTLFGCLFNLPGVGGLSAENRQKFQEQTEIVTKIIEMKNSHIEIE